MTLTNNLRKIYTMSLIVFVVSVLVKLYFSNSLVSDNRHLNELSLKRDDLQKEISRLTYVENNLSALNILEQRAYSLGFVKMTDSLISLDINTSTAIAYNTSN